jgi:hypothetical protein
MQRPKHEAESENAGSYNSTPIYSYVFMAMWLIKYKDNFILTLALLKHGRFKTFLNDQYSKTCLKRINY